MFFQDTFLDPIFLILWIFMSKNEIYGPPSKSNGVQNGSQNQHSGVQRLLKSIRCAHLLGSLEPTRDPEATNALQGFILSIFANRFWDPLGYFTWFVDGSWHLSLHNVLACFSSSLLGRKPAENQQSSHGNKGWRRHTKPRPNHSVSNSISTTVLYCFHNTMGCKIAPNINQMDPKGFKTHPGVYFLKVLERSKIPQSTADFNFYNLK
jgi:hypothetical protein